MSDHGTLSSPKASAKEISRSNAPFRARVPDRRCAESRSQCDQRRTMQPGVGVQLVQNEGRNVFSRYGPTMEVGEIRESADRAAAGLVVQDGGTNQDPVEPAVSDDGLLPVLVGVHLRQEKRKDHVVEEKTAVPCA